MDKMVVVDLMPELEKLSGAFRLALVDRSYETCDLLQVGLVKLLETSEPAIILANRRELEKRWMMKVFISALRDLERRATGSYGRWMATNVPEQILEAVEAPFTNLLTRLSVEECLETLPELDRRIVRELVEPSAPVLNRMEKRLETPRRERVVTFSDIAAGRNLPLSRVRTAVASARQALVYGGLRPSA